MNPGTDLFGDPIGPPASAMQPLLFDSAFYRDSIGMAGHEAATLRTAGLLSFDPNTLQPLTEAQVMELDFVWALHKSGCPTPFLERLLSDLPKPYAYPVSEMHLDWRTLTWTRLLSPDETVAKWVDSKLAAADGDELLRLAGKVQEALAELGLSPDSEP
jgi:hypothetical protein